MANKDERPGWSLRRPVDEPRPFVPRLAVVTLVLFTIALFAGIGGACFAVKYRGLIAIYDTMPAVKWRFVVGAAVGALLAVAFLACVYFSQRHGKHRTRARSAAGRWKLH
jgi:hypothetical protein